MRVTISYAGDTVDEIRANQGSGDEYLIETAATTDIVTLCELGHLIATHRDRTRYPGLETDLGYYVGFNIFNSCCSLVEDREISAITGPDSALRIPDRLK